MLASLKKAVHRLDSWVNLITGVGVNTGRNALVMRAAEGDYLTQTDLEQLYNLDGLAARIVRAVPQHALRQGFKVATGDTSVETAVRGALDDLHAAEKLRLAWTWGRLYGGGAVFVGADDGKDPREPIDMGALRRVRFLVDVDRYDLTPQTYVSDPLLVRFGQPETYQLMRQGGGAASSMTIVHESRILRFDGAEVTRRRRIANQGWGDSVLQRVYTELQAARGAFAAVGSLVHESSQGVFKMKDLMSMMGADSNDTLKRRLEVMDMSRSIARAIMIDADGEEFTRVEVGAMTGLVEILDRFVNFVSAVSEMPVTVLMGQAPAGLNATGESDIRSWYDAVQAEREAVLRPEVERLVQMILLSREGPTGGKEPEGWKVSFPPLWQPTPNEEAELRSKVADTDVKYIGVGVVTPEEVALARFRPEGWSAETSIDLAARKALQEADAGGGVGADAPGADHAEGIANIIAKVAAREIPRDSGVAMLASSFGLDPAAADAQMGEAGRTFFTKPDPAAVTELDSLRAETAKLRASNLGHQQYTARVIQRAKEGGLELGAFASGPPTVVAEGDDLKPGDVVEVPKTDGLTMDVRLDGGRGVAVVLPLPPGVALPAQIAAVDLHVTLAYLGPIESPALDDARNIDRLVDAVRAWAAVTPPITAVLGGIGRFAPGPDGEPVYIPVDSEAIAARRPVLLGHLAAAGYQPAPGHGFTPHLTLAYVQPGDPTPAPVPATTVRFDRVAVWIGGTRVEAQLTGPTT